MDEDYIESTIIRHAGDMEYLTKWVQDPTTPLEAINACASYGYTNLVKILLDRGANPNNVKDDHFIYDGSTPLQMAVYDGNIELFKLLLDRGADPYESDVGLLGQNLLFGATCPEIIQTLIDKGLDVNHQDDEGSTPLHVIPEVNTLDNILPAIKVLLRNGANIMIKDHSGR